MEEHHVLQGLVEISASREPNEAKIDAIDRDKLQKIYTSPFSPQSKQARLQR
jgi:hypothetical protein